MRGSVHILVPKLIAKIGFDAIDAKARELNCQARGSSGEHSAVVDLTRSTSELMKQVSQ